MQHANPEEGEPVNSALGVARPYPAYVPPLTLSTSGNHDRSALVTPKAPEYPGSALLFAIETAAELASAKIAEATKQSPEEIRRQLEPTVLWLSRAEASANADAEPLRPPVVAREYISEFRAQLLAEMETATCLEARDVVRLLIRVDEAADAWKQTDRGKFISRLTGSDCADAVVAIAHDIRSPLCSILLLVDSLRRAERGYENPVRERQLGLIYSAALGLSTTVSNLIGAARGELLVHGKPAPFSVAETMHAVSAIVLPMCEEKGLPLEVHLPKSDARIGHSYALHQALLNLTSNAIRYTDVGSVSLGCTERSGNLVEFWVKDTGPGVPETALERLYDGFPAEGSALRFSSAGLGLAIVRTLVEAMGSTLQVNTSPTGTRFSFRLQLPPAPWGS